MIPNLGAVYTSKIEKGYGSFGWALVFGQVGVVLGFKNSSGLLVGDMCTWASRPMSFMCSREGKQGAGRPSTVAPPAPTVAARRSSTKIELRSTVSKSEGMGRESRVRGFSFEAGLG